MTDRDEARQRSSANRENRGQRIFEPSHWKALAESLGLCTRELQIVQAIFDNQKTTAIAADLGISVSTVNTYIHRLHHKLAVKSRVELVLRVVGQSHDMNGFDHNSAPSSDGPSAS